MTEAELLILKEIFNENHFRSRTDLLPALHAVQNVFGYISEEAATEISSQLKIPLAEIFGVIDFYSLFYDKPVSKIQIHVCNDPVCAMAGSDKIYKVSSISNIQDHFQFENTVTIERSPCLGLCEHAPALLVHGLPVGEAERKTWTDLVAGHGKPPRSVIGGDISNLTSNCGKGRRTTFEEYQAGGGYSGLNRALSIGSAATLEEVKKSGLVGRGGAAFPTGLKWESAVNNREKTRYLICNADEAEPGTFKDRVMMEDDPHRILEGMIIAGFAINASKGYMYIRGEYLLQFQSMEESIVEARNNGLIGDNIFGSGYSFDIELRRGAGAYVCGEETALFESIEGKRGFPRIKPPFPTTSGLFGKPTVINNVETLCNIPEILAKGALEYRLMGTEKSPGTKLFCLSGDVLRPGLYEVPFGVTFEHLLFDLAGGVRNGHVFKSALFGGAAGAFATDKDLKVKLSFENLRAAGLPLGSGVITVFDETRDLKDILFRLARFFAEESCGKCFPCQIGTQRQLEIVERLNKNCSFPGDRERLLDIAATMTDASICGLGQTAASAIMSAIKLWPELFAQQ